MAHEIYEKIKQAHPLPSPTGVALEILRLAGDESTTLASFSHVVESDPAIAGRLLKLANSSFAGAPRRVTSVTTAVQLLGIRTVRNLALGFSLVRNHRNGPCRPFNYDEFWRRSLAHAVAGRAIASLTGGFAPDEVFTLGLLSDIGRLGFATAFPEEYGRLLHAAGPIEPSRLAVLERQTFEIDHGTLAAEMMREWHCEEFLCSVVSRLHAGDEPAGNGSERADRMLRVLQLAESIAADLISPRREGATSPELLQRAAVLGLSDQDVSSLLKAIASEWKEAGNVFSIDTREIDTREIVSPEQLRSGALPTEARSDKHPATSVSSPEAANPPLRVLAVDDDSLSLRLLQQHLVKAGCEVTTAASGAEALAIDLRSSPQMIITDWMMPEIDGLELCRRLRAHGDLGFVYVIIVTAQAEKDRVVQALNAGADDYLAKPYSREELLAKVRAGHRVVRLQEELASRTREIAQYNARLTIINDRLRAASITDELTGLPNRREAVERLTEHWAIAQRYGEPLACIAGDLDWFKQLNDCHGHASGDAALREVARRMKAVLRTGETAYRMGGEEFLIICPRSPASGAEKAAERVRQALAAEPVVFEGRVLRITMSLGVAERLTTMRAPDDLLQAADKALYAAKAAGRNRVEVAGNTCAETKPTTPLSRNANESDEQTLRAIPWRPEREAGPIRVAIVGFDPTRQDEYRTVLEANACSVVDLNDVPGQSPADEAPPASPELILIEPGGLNQDSLRRLITSARAEGIPLVTIGEAKAPAVASVDDVMEEHLTEPVDADELVRCIRLLAGVARGRRELAWSNTVRGEQARVLMILLDLSCALASAEDLDALLERLVAAAAEMSQSRRVSIMLPTADGTHLTIAKSIGIKPEQAAAVRVPVGCGIAGRVFAEGEPVVVNSNEDIVHQKERYESCFFVSAPLAAKLLRANDTPLGVLNITERCDARPFTAMEMESVEVLCNVAATAISGFMSRSAREKTRDSIVTALATLAEHRDTNTGRHLDRVTYYAMTLAKALGSTDQHRDTIDRAFLDSLKRAVTLHDIGKVAVPDHILLKPGRLTPEEMSIMQRHAEAGARTLQSVASRSPDANFLTMAIQIAHCHHERWDGNGYPARLAGEQIPLAARIAAVADVYDALTSSRPYKEAMPHARAAELILAGTGTQFDPAVVETFKRCEAQFARAATDLADDSPAEDTAGSCEVSRPTNASAGETKSQQAVVVG